MNKLSVDVGEEYAMSQFSWNLKFNEYLCKKNEFKFMLVLGRKVINVACKFGQCLINKARTFFHKCIQSCGVFYFFFFLECIGQNSTEIFFFFAHVAQGRNQPI